MTDPTQQNSSGASDPQANPPPQGDSADASPTNDVAARAAEQAALEAQPKADRPEWANDDIWDGEKNSLREDALKERLAEAEKFRSALAKTPQKPEEYKIEIPEEIAKTIPEGMEVKPEDKQWQFWRTVANKVGLTQDQFRDAAGAIVAAQIEAAKGAEAHRDSIHKALGDRGAERVEGVKVWMKGAFGDKIAGQLQHTLFTPDIVKAFEKIQTALTNQGVTTFSQSGREGDPAPGSLPGYSTMTFEQRMAAARQVNRASNGRA